jgi:GntR family transcriptional regulator
MQSVIFLVARNYLCYSRFPELLYCKELENVSLYGYLANRYNAVATTGKRQVELLRLNDEGIAAQLHVDVDSHVLFNREITYDQNEKVLEYYESWHHPDRTRLTIDLERTY